MKNIKALPSIIENSKYTYSKDEIGKLNKAHKGVKQWHYFAKQIETDTGKYNVTINIRDKGNEQFVYEVAFRKIRKE